MRTHFILILLFIGIVPVVDAQQAVIRGKVEIEEGDFTFPLAGVALSDALGVLICQSDTNGLFECPISEALRTIHVSKEGYETQVISLDDDGDDELYFEILLVPDDVDAIPVIVLDDNESEDELTDEISSLLTASRDFYTSTAAYSWGPLRFRLRGYESGETEVNINGMRINDAESGRVFWNLWGGLNDVTRRRHSTQGLSAVDHTFGGVGGSTDIDMRASKQRKQLRVSYSLSNRSYRNRVMLTYSSGLLPGDWSISVSGSRRWAQEGYIPGTFYDAWAYYVGVDKKFGYDHTLSVIAFGAPIRRGKAGPAIQLMYDIAGTNYYNSYWGYQEGDKRNARIADTHIPVGILAHQWALSDRTNLSTFVSFQSGKNGSTAFNWGEASDPRADYYQKWPNYYEDEEVQDNLRNYLAAEESRRQVNWSNLYNRNYANIETIENVNGSGERTDGQARTIHY